MENSKWMVEGGSSNRLDGRAAIQKDLSRLEKWADGEQNVSKRTFKMLE